MTLGSLIQILEGYPPGHRVRYEDGRVPSQFDSWRGVYAELTLMSGAAESRTVVDLLFEARAADGATFQGYKGGDFTMGLHTPVAEYNPGPVAYEGADDHRGEPALAGQLITRDGDPRPLLGGGARRRTFLIDHMENVEVIS